MALNDITLVFLGTGAAWALPELNCPCAICKSMRLSGERRSRTALLLEGDFTLLVDCGPDILAQLEANKVKRIDAVLITHEHGDHYIGLDELFVFKRNQPRGSFRPIPVYLTPLSWKIIRARFEYLKSMEVISIRLIEPGHWFRVGPFEVFPFKTNHGKFAKGSVGYAIKVALKGGLKKSTVYTSDFMDIPYIADEIKKPDILVIQSFWLNEPKENRPSHMSFQRAIKFIKEINPRQEAFIVHMGDADMVQGDPHNNMAKKYEPLNPFGPPGKGQPYPIPLNHAQWQQLVERVRADHSLDHKITVPRDGMRVSL